jgi:DNA-binding LacI/PurR family transcriptional regulator
VRDLASRLGYVPNQAARSLVRQRSTTFGLMTPDVTDPIHGQIVTGFQRRAAESGYTVILANGLLDADTERRELREFAAHRVAAVTAMGTVLPPKEAVGLVAPSPMMLIGSEHLPVRGGPYDLRTGCLRPDDRDGMRQVVTHLLERGYRRMAFIVAAAPWASHVLRLAALTDALAEHALPAPAVYRAERADTERLAPVAARLRVDRPDVAICYDDQTALHLMDALRSVGLDVPGDIGVVGFDDIPFARIANPRLTTVAQHAEDLGRTCVDLLLAALAGGRLPRSHALPVSLVIRETTPARQGRRR